MFVEPESNVLGKRHLTGSLCPSNSVGYMVFQFGVESEGGLLLHLGRSHAFLLPFKVV